MYLHGLAKPSWLQSLRAALHAAGPQSFASHRSAGALHGIVTRREPAEISTSHPSDLPPTHTVKSYRSRRPFRRPRTLNGIRVASVERTLLDLAAVLSDLELECAVETALLRKLTTEERLWKILVTDGGRGVAGSAAFRRVLETRPNGKPARSVLEVIAGRLLRRAALGPFERNYGVIDPEGPIFEIDFAFVAHRIAVEVDGRAFHSTRTQTRRDQRRQRRLEDLGWYFIRVSWRDVVVRPSWVVEQVRAAIAERAHAWPRIAGTGR